VTLTPNVHDAPAASVAPLRLMVPDPATAVIVPPHRCPSDVWRGDDESRRQGVGERDAAQRCTAFGLVTVNVTDVDPFNAIELVPKAFVIVAA